MTKSSGSFQEAGRCDGGILLEEVTEVLWRGEKRRGRRKYPGTDPAQAGTESTMSGIHCLSGAK